MNPELARPRLEGDISQGLDKQAFWTLASSSATTSSGDLGETVPIKKVFGYMQMLFVRTLQANLVPFRAVPSTTQTPAPCAFGCPGLTD